MILDAQKRKEKKEKKHKRSLQAVPNTSRVVDNPISMDDYFTKSTEYQLWLKAMRCWAVCKCLL